MAKTFRPTTSDRIANAVLGSLLRVGLGPSFMRLLTVTGRRTGQPHTTPVVPVQTDQGRWLVAPYGEVGWVRNARAAGKVTLRRGRASETLAVTELSPADAVPVLREYLDMKLVRQRVQPYFDVTPQSSDAEFAADAAHHPVFELRAVAA
jgi:deazaflavin-dependent oxidoreductase (nitroreductase family)